MFVPKSALIALKGLLTGLQQFSTSTSLLLKYKNFTDMKMKTRLYKLTKGTSFYDMSLENDFTSDYFGDLKKVNYNQLTPVCS